MNAIENCPSLIDCLDMGRSGFFLDLGLPSVLQGGPVGASIRKGPFSRTVNARIVTSGNDRLEDVHLVMQRNRYDLPGSLVSVNNNSLEAAWQNAFAFHTRADWPTSPVYFRHQVNETGTFHAFNPLFVCLETKRWFHPVCPQCGMALTLCRDDALLQKRGLPAYTDSLVRFLYCGSCAQLSDTAPFYCHEKSAGMPNIVHDKDVLIAGWKHLLETLPGEADLPCRGCPNVDSCYGPESLVNRRIVPFGFYPFYMLMFPAPSCGAAEFLDMLSGRSPKASAATTVAAGELGRNRFLFQDQDRLFLEVLYLKLAFLEQVCRRFMPQDDSTTIPEVDLSLSGIGVDLSPNGAGLPAYWHFNVRILDAVGNFQTSPFAPIMPEAPRLHFIGALWFRTLLVNSIQDTDAVYAEVGRLVDQLTHGDRPETLPIDSHDPTGVFAANQIYWSPNPKRIPEEWHLSWQEALRLGIQLVQAGLKTGVAWDGRAFLTALDGLRQQIRTEMFSSSAIGVSVSARPAPHDRLGMMLDGILGKWQAAAESAPERPIPEVDVPAPDGDETMPIGPSAGVSHMPTENGLSPHADGNVASGADLSIRQAEATGWDQDVQETVILSSADVAPPTAAVQPTGVEPPAPDSQWNDDGEETVVQQGAVATPLSEPEPSDDDMDRTVVISPLSTPNKQALPGPDSEMAETLIQAVSDTPPASFDAGEGDQEATVILNAGGLAAAESRAASNDDDLEATMVQGAGGPPLGSIPAPGMVGMQPTSPPQSGDDLEATMIISPPGSQAVGPTPGGADEDLTATRVETLRNSTNPGRQQAITENKRPSPPIPPGPSLQTGQSPPPDTAGSEMPEPANEDDDIMEQTIIIRSDVTKE